MWVVLFKLQGSYLVKVRIPKGAEKKQVHLLKKSLQLCKVTILNLKKILCLSALSEACAHKPAECAMKSASSHLCSCSGCLQGIDSICLCLESTLGRLCGCAKFS